MYWNTVLIRDVFHYRSSFCLVFFFALQSTKQWSMVVETSLRIVDPTSALYQKAFIAILLCVCTSTGWWATSIQISEWIGMGNAAGPMSELSGQSIRQSADHQKARFNANVRAFCPSRSELGNYPFSFIWKPFATNHNGKQQLTPPLSTQRGPRRLSRLHVNFGTAPLFVKMACMHPQP